MENFDELGLQEAVLQSIKDLGFEKPTPIQAKTIPILLSSDQDILGLAQTGTGKTAAFGLPAIELTDTSNKATQTLILAPTRELCLQITRDMETYAKHLKGVKITAVYGGASIDTQIRALNRGVHIVVGTPGRTKDLIKRKKLKLDELKRVILDEADEMLTMGFKEELDSILDATPEAKQMLLFSATMSKGIVAVSKKYMNDPVQVTVARVNAMAENVNHLYYLVQARDRYEVVKRLADGTPNIYAIIFCRTRRETKEIADSLMQDGYGADALHGDLSQAQRDEVMKKFRKKTIHILVATDVAARGLDVDKLTHVINYKLPDSPEIYTHRSGRTGRAGNSGVSVVIIHAREGRQLSEIERKTGVKFQRAMVPSGMDICGVQLHSFLDRVEQVEVDEKRIAQFLPAIEEKLGHMDKETLIKHFVSSAFNRFLNYYKDARDINLSKEGRRKDKGHDRDRDRGRSRDRDDRGRGRDRDRRRDKDGRREGRSRDFEARSNDRPERRVKKSRAERQEHDYVRLFINAGSKNDLTPTRLISLVNEEMRSDSFEIGKIEILKKFSFFEIETKHAGKAITALSGKDFDGFKLSLEEAQSTEEIAKNYPKKDKKKKKSSSKDYFKGGKKRKKKK